MPAIILRTGSSGNATVPPFAQNSQGGASPAIPMPPAQAWADWCSNSNGNNENIIIAVITASSSIKTPASTTDLDYGITGEKGFWETMEANFEIGTSLGYDLSASTGLSTASNDGFLDALDVAETTSGTVILAHIPTGGASNTNVISLIGKGWTISPLT